MTAARRLFPGAVRSFPFLLDDCQPEIFPVEEFSSLLLHQLESPRAKFPQEIACLITECSVGFGFTSGTQAIVSKSHAYRLFLIWLINNSHDVLGFGHGMSLLK